MLILTDTFLILEILMFIILYIIHNLDKKKQKNRENLHDHQI